MRRLLLVVTVVLAAGAARAQGGRAFDAGPYAGVVWTIADGLPQNTVYDLVQSRDGYLWGVTDSGPVRFDGVAFETYHHLALPSPLTTAVHEDAAGRIWVGTYDGGAARYVPPTPEAPRGRFEALTQADGLPGDFVLDFADGADGALWIATGAGLARVRGDEVTAFTTADGLPPGPPGHVHAVLVDRTGTVWAGTRGGLAYFDGLPRTRSGGAAFVPVDLGVLESVSVYALAAAPDGTLWAGTSAGLVHYAGVRTRRYTTADGLAH
ncbi:MAG: two-component regulator propeller domain-containing protein, partial [Rhodothermales bacterium]|nr:two-component regulator propeller domain-containing protein [Rhodothermales bacterium]